MKSSDNKKGLEIKEDMELQDIFVAFHQKLVISFRKKLEDMKFTFPQLETLRFIREKKNPTMKDIADYLSISAPSATSMVEYLSKKGLLKRKIDSKDRRTVRVVTTSNAFKLLDSFNKIKSLMFRDMFKNLNEGDKKKLAGIFKKLI